LGAQQVLGREPSWQRGEVAHHDLVDEGGGDGGFGGDAGGRERTRHAD